MHESPRAHRTGFLGDVQVALGETPIAQGGLCLRDRQHLGMRGGVLELFDLVVRPGNNLAVANNHRANGDFILIPSAPRHPERLSHEEIVALEVNQGRHRLADTARHGSVPGRVG